MGHAAHAPRLAFTGFLGAALLFCVEPIVAKTLLPLLGGAPAVWTTCMLFFQTTLLAGYAYAHVMPAWLGVRRHALVHAVLVFAPLAMLPIGFADVSTAPWSSTNPVVSLLVLLATRVGLPFFFLSTTTPLLQRWFHFGSAGRDPYFLYAASNLGSIVALAAYPLVLEPLLGLRDQGRLWHAGYVFFAVLGSASALVTWRSRSATTVDAAPASVTPSLARGRILRWTALAFVPSSLLYGVTTYITTDIAPIPLFWVLPLGLYLATFVLVFAKKPPISQGLVVRLLPLAATGAAFVVLAEIAQPGWLALLVHLAMFFLACMVCHGELARDRPSGEQLTAFYFFLSLGGVLGGAFNGLLAPVVFSRIVEYPIAIVLACLCCPGTPRASRRLSYAIVVGLCVLTATLVFGARAFSTHRAGLAVAIVLGVPLLLNCAQLHRPTRFAAGLGAIFLLGSFYAGTAGHTLTSDRNFFGVVKVTRDTTRDFVEITHGNTIHGRQSTNPERRREGLSYFHSTGPLGAVFAAYDHSPAPGPGAVGVIGLGAGTMASYAKPGTPWTFYEIDPAVVRIAQDPRYFTYLADAFPEPGALTIVLGDARLRLREAPEGAYGLLVLDAFSSDAIPVHLLTRQAIALYFTKIAPHGMLALHVSNRYLDLKPVVADIARDAGLAARSRDDLDVSDELLARGKTPSQWIVLARSSEDLRVLEERDTRWAHLTSDGHRRVWTDDYSNLLFALKR